MHIPDTTPGVAPLRRLVALAALLAALTFAPAASAADEPILLVHGYGDASKGKDCNGDIFKEALRYYQDAAGRERSSLVTIGYYPGDKGRCDAMIGDGKASNQRPIQDIARDLAHYIAGRGEPVDIVAHSMGGLVTRVALLGSAQGWQGFPSGKLKVGNVVTLGTPHQGVSSPGASDTRQWKQMRPGSGFLDRLQEDKLSGGWASATDWSLVGSREDGTVSYDSAIDKGNAADQKFGYLANGGKVTHTGVRALSSGRYALSYWHAAGDHPAHRTDDGWAPLKAAYQAATHVGDNLPR